MVKLVMKSVVQVVFYLLFLAQICPASILFFEKIHSGSNLENVSKF